MNATYHEIADLAHYNALMGRSIMDKLFFVDKITADTIVDYGSADGLLIDNLQFYFPDSLLIGYDNNKDMNRLAAERALRHGDRQIVKFVDDWNFVKEAIAANPKGKTALILSSVIHEIYTYLEVKEIDVFWQRVFNSGFDYIVIRDMIPSRSMDRVAEINDIAKIYRKYLNSQALKDFENNFGSIESNRNLVHFLLKYRYTHPNWAREVKENYFPLNREDLLAMLPIDYDIIYHDHFVLPYLREQIKTDFRIDLRDATHLKLILKKC